jgi:hypothetical protein
VLLSAEVIQYVDAGDQAVEAEFVGDDHHLAGVEDR